MGDYRLMEENAYNCFCDGRKTRLGDIGGGGRVKPIC